MADEQTQTTATETQTTETARPNETSVLGEQTTEQAAETKTEQTTEAKPETKASEPPALDIKSVKIPEGFKADDVQLNEFGTILGDPNLTPNDRAQKLVDLHTKALKAAAEEPSKAWDDLTVKWVGEIAADKDLGSGDAKSPLKPEVKAGLSKIIDQVGGTELRQALDFTGAGNNPAIVRAFYKLGQHLVEGKPVTGNPPTSKPPATAGGALYPDLPTG